MASSPPKTAKPSIEDSTEKLYKDVEAQRSQDIWIILVALRTLNAVFTGTFFQPDEFYQSLEPAWKVVFGPDSGAWMTWEWTHQLRSSIFPLFFAGVYQLITWIANLADFPPNLRTQLLLMGPSCVQALIAANMDYSSWKLAERIYGTGSKESWAVLGLTALSPWQGFASTRTFSNSAEASLTVLALSVWPWQWYKPSGGSELDTSETTSLRVCFVAAAAACVLRPTNLLIWVPLTILTMRRANRAQIMTAVREMVICGSGVLGLSALSDRYYYGEWTFPPLRWLQFNITQDLAVFYGQNRADYYITEGIPLLLTTALPFAIVGMFNALRKARPSKANEMKSSTALSPFAASMKQDLAILVLIVMAAFSFISHKEVRFIYPILPILFVLAAPPAAYVFHDVLDPKAIFKKILLAILVGTNAFLILYTTINHQRGVIDVMTFLRREYEFTHLKMDKGNITVPNPPPMSVGFLMPCHSTPWRSQLIWPGIEAWALSCEPPIDLVPEARATYLDEADQFYANPTAWLKTNLGTPPKGLLRVLDSKSALDGKQGKREWPQKLVHFSQLDETLNKVLAGTKYEECSRGFNSRFHDDWRRQGDVVVRCLDFVEESMAPL